jgi:hypothetical protein
MAKQDPGEPLDPAYKYIDRKIKLLKKDLDRIENSLLETQRTVTDFMMITNALYFADTVKEGKPDLYYDFYTQMTADLSKAITQTETSVKPLSVYNEFTKECQSQIKQMGITLIDFS